MRLGKLIDLQHALGGTKPQQKPKVSYAYAEALKVCAGLTGRVLFDIDAALEWAGAHPEFRQIDAVRSRRCKLSNRRAEAVGMSRE